MSHRRTGRPGGQFGNLNGLTSGVRSRLVKRWAWRSLADHNPSLKPIEAQVEKLRRALEQEVVAAVGEVDLTVASALDAICSFGFVELLIDRILEKPDTEERQLLELSEKRARLKKSRHELISKLPRTRNNLDAFEGVFNEIYSPLPYPKAEQRIMHNPGESDEEAEADEPLSVPAEFEAVLGEMFGEVADA